MDCDNENVFYNPLILGKTGKTPDKKTFEIAFFLKFDSFWTRRPERPKKLLMIALKFPFRKIQDLTWDLLR